MAESNSTYRHEPENAIVADENLAEARRLYRH